MQLLEGKLHLNLEPLYRNVDGKQKVLTSITHKISEFVSAYRFYDVVVRLGAGRVSFDVLKQPRLDGYIGDKVRTPFSISLHIC